MAIVSSGEIAIKDDTLQAGSTSIALEVDENTTGDKNLSTLGASAGLDVDGTSMSEFYGYAGTTYGEMYGHEDYSGDAYLKRVTEGSTYLMSSGLEDVLFQATINESTRATKSLGIFFVASDNAGAIIYRRAKGTTDTFITARSWISSYTSESYACDFSTYDYKWYVTDA